ncbi:DUF2971 domain-containing protein [Formosa sp. 4Alg 33]|uniref:DUF2971 domain-containing protein n=1 Tax=Formosa sp. 4Alg 33 TaxID=3382189 RepID=UPI003D9C43F1
MKLFISALQSNVNSVKITEEAPPSESILYHYTSFQSALNIIESEKLWTTHIKYLNDLKEFQHAVDLTRNILTLKLRNNKNELEVFIYKLLLDWIKNKNGANTFIFSLTEKSDLLSQWRGYCTKGGVSIGFNYSKLKAKSKSQGFRLVKCVYDIEKQEEFIEKIINEIKDKYTKNHTSYVGSKINELSQQFYSSFLLMATRLKHPSFREEKEWRLIGGPFSNKLEKFKFRSALQMLIPFYEFDLFSDKNLMIEKIVIGPNKDQQLAGDSFRLYIHKKEKGWSLKNSEIPFKGE